MKMRNELIGTKGLYGKTGWEVWLFTLIVILALALSGILPVQAAGSDLFVRPDGNDAICNGSSNVAFSASLTDCALATIQTAINKAVAGSTIQVANGTYAGSLVINKGLTLIGESRAGVVITYTSGYGINTTASNVTLKSFSLQGVAGTLYGLKIEGKAAAGSDPSAKYTNIWIEDVATQSTGRSGIDINGIDGLTVRNVNAKNTVSGVGVALSDVDNATLDGITTSGNPWGGLAIYTMGSAFPGGSNHVNLVGTNSFAESNPIYVETGNASNPAAPYPVENFTAAGFRYIVKANTSAHRNYTFYRADLSAAGSFAVTLPGSYIRNLATGQLEVLAGMHIQTAIDAAGANDTVNVYPGTYDETAPGKTLFNGNGPHQFGLFVGSDKPGLTLRGLDASGAPITDYHNVLASIRTNATNNFGTSGIFVEGDNVKISGLKILPNTAGDNKTIEVIGDHFQLLNSHIDIAGGGSVYLGDERFNEATQTSYIQTYQIEGNWLDHGTSIDIANGAGFTGDPSPRIIKGNTFSMEGAYWPGISFSGTVPTVGWYKFPVGGAAISGNTFSGGEQYIRARGTYNEGSFDWMAYWNNNTFDKAVIVGASLPGDLRTYAYTVIDGTDVYQFDNVRRIGATIQGEVDNAQDGDTVLVKAGTYPESPNLNKSVILRSESGRDQTTILGALRIDGAEITVDGFTITGFDATTGLASTNIFLTPKPEKVSILNNRIKVGNIGAGTNGDDGIGLLTTYTTTSDVSQLLVQGNQFEPLNAIGRRAFYINPGVDKFTFRQNTITGNFGGMAITQARNGLVEDNTLTGSGTSAGLGVWGYPTPSIYGKTTFQRNDISLTVRAISIIAAENVIIANNNLHGNGIGVLVSDSDGLSFNPATLQIHANRITVSGTYGLVNETQTKVAASDNYWGTLSWYGYGSVTGIRNLVSGNVTWEPWTNAALSDALVKPVQTFADPANAGKLEGAAGASGGVVGYSAFVGLQDAVNHVAANGQVNAAAGSYTEQIVVTQSLKLIGAGLASTTIKAPATIPAVADPNSTILRIAGAGINVELSGFTIAGPGPSPCESLKAGILVRDGATANIHHNRITNIRDSVFSGCQNGVGIYVGRSDLILNTSGTATITNNQVDFFQKNGIVVANTGSSAVIANNTVTGAGPTGVIAQNGIQVSYGATATLTGNTVSGFSYTPIIPSDTVSTAILLFSGDADTNGNTISDAQVGIYAFNSSGTHTGNQIHLTKAGTGSNSLFGVIVDDPAPGHRPSPVDEKIVAGPAPRGLAAANANQVVTVSNNELVSDQTAGGVGIEVDGGYGALNIDFSASNNLIQNWGTGVALTQCTGPTGCTTAGYVKSILSQNSFTGNTTGLASSAPITVDARSNWWDGNHGPQVAANLNGNGEAVTGIVTIDPWLCDGTDTRTDLVGFQPSADNQCTNAVTRMVFSSQPSNGIATQNLPVQPVVRVEGSNGELAINFSDGITLLMANNPGGAILTGTTSRAAVNGVATFSGLSVDRPGSAYTLLALSGLLNATSEPFKIIPFEADLGITNGFIPEAVSPRGNWTIQLTVSNQGPVNASQLTLRDTLPAGVEFVSAAGTGWTCSQAQGVVTCSSANLAAGGSSALSIVVKMPMKPGNITNRASVSSNVADPASADNETSASTVIAGVPVTGGNIYIPVLMTQP